MIDGKTRVCGLIGKPVAHTLSPMIHNTLAEKTGLNLSYLPFLVEDDVICAVKGAYELGILGLNITVPYKSSVMGALADMDPLAAMTGAVNTLVRTKEGYKGYNTDMSGLYRALQSEKITLQKEPVIILGAGGAARAVAFLCADKGAEEVYLLNRNLEKAQQVAEEVNSAFGKKMIQPMELSQYQNLPEQNYLAIQATSVGLAPNVAEAVIEDPEFYKKIHTGYDLIYRPGHTKFMQLVEQNGGTAYSGLKMLLYQGIEAFELWNNVSIPDEIVLELYEKLREETNVDE